MKNPYSFKSSILSFILISILTFQFLNVSSQGTSGSVLFVHADNPSSYGGSGNIWSDLSGNANDGTISGATYDATNKVFVFDDSVHHICQIFLLMKVVYEH